MKATFASLCVVAALCLRSAVEASPLLEKRGNCYNGGKQSILTNYWIPAQGSTDMTNDGNTIHLNGPDTVPIKDSNGKVIAKVDKNTYQKCLMEGTCIIHSHGRDLVINLANNGGSDARFEVLNSHRTPFGIGSGNDNPLRPFVSVAVNDLPRGTLLYVKEFDGMKLPNNLVHNGCVSVDDNGWSFGGCQLDYFVLKYEYYQQLQTPGKVTVVKKNCKVLDYSTADDYGYVGVNPPANVPKPGGGVGFHHHKSSSSSSSSSSPSSSTVSPTKTKGRHGKTSTPSSATAAASCDSSNAFAKTFDDTNLGGSSTCLAGPGCHKLSGVTKSATWPSGKTLTLFASSDCSGSTLYVDSAGEDTDMSGDGNGFHAGSVLIQ